LNLYKIVWQGITGLDSCCHDASLMSMALTTALPAISAYPGAAGMRDLAGELAAAVNDAIIQAGDYELDS
jgi:hypothetical protein